MKWTRSKLVLLFSISILLLLLSGHILHQLARNSHPGNQPLGHYNPIHEASNTTGTNGYAKQALIYDPLYRDHPNKTLYAIIIPLLKSNGYEVTVYAGRNATLEPLVYMNGYSLVIIRAHGGYNNKSSGIYGRGEYIFTGLLYNEALSYYGDTIQRLVKKGELAVGVVPPDNSGVTENELNELPKQLVVSPLFIQHKTMLKKGAVIFVFSCYSMNDQTLAQVFTGKGAAGVIGWRGGVTDRYMDAVLPIVVEEYVSKGLRGVERFIGENGLKDPVTGGELQVYSGK